MVEGVPLVGGCDLVMDLIPFYYSLCFLCEALFFKIFPGGFFEMKKE